MRKLIFSHYKSEVNFIHALNVYATSKKKKKLVRIEVYCTKKIQIKKL